MRQRPGRILLSHPLIPETFGIPVERADRKLGFYLARGWQVWPGDEPEPEPEPERKTRRTRPAKPLESVELACANDENEETNV